MFTAAIMMCLMDIERSFETCSVAYGKAKYKTEEVCWASINVKVLYFARYPETTNGHEVAYAKCTSWLPISGSGV